MSTFSLPLGTPLSTAETRYRQQLEAAFRDERENRFFREPLVRLEDQRRRMDRVTRGLTDEIGGLLRIDDLGWDYNYDHRYLLVHEDGTEIERSFNLRDLMRLNESEFVDRLVHTFNDAYRQSQRPVGRREAPITWPYPAPEPPARRRGLRVRD